NVSSPSILYTLSLHDALPIFLALINALAAFFESRFALVAEESKAAAVQLLILVGCLIFAVLLCALGYVFLITGAVVGLAHLAGRSEEHTSELQSRGHLVCRLL